MSLKTRVPLLSLFSRQGLLGVLLLAASSLQPALAAESLGVVIDGYTYHAELTANDMLQGASAEQRALAKGSHYTGQLREAADSWVRLSHIGDRWQGIVSLNGQVHVIARDNGPMAMAHSYLQALGDEPAACGVEHAPTSALSSSALSLPQAESLDYSALCTTTIDGICLLSELEVVFDLAFQQRFPDDYVDQASSLLNMVEGYYRNALNVSFDVLTMTYPTSELFSATTDSGAFLTSIREKKSGLSFLENQRALTHVVTGRDFDGGYVGVAYIGVLCGQSYATGTSQVVNNDITLTALTVAHELGHNFGSGHDTETSCSSGYVMGPSLSMEAIQKGFSSCSKSAMQSEISSLTSPAACFNFPVNAGISAGSGNPASVEREAVFELSYGISYEYISETADILVVDGRLVSGDGIILSATLAGSACNLASNKLSYTCSLTLPLASATLRVEAVGTGNEARFSHSVGVEGSVDIAERVSGNNSVDTRVAVVALGQPDDLAGTASGNAITLDWTDRSNVETGYQVQRRVSGTANWAVLSGGLAPDSQQYTDNSIALGIRYDYQVKALAAGGSGAGSNIITVINEPAPGTPGNFQATASGDRISLHWTDTADNEIGFWVERQRAGGTAWVLLAELESNANGYDDKTALIGQTYHYRVIAMNSTKSSDPSNTASATITVKAPTNLTIERQGDGLLLTWQDQADNESGYRVERRAPRGLWLTLASLEANAVRYLDNGLALGDTYEYRVRAVGGNVVSEPSNSLALGDTADSGTTQRITSSDSGSSSGGGSSSGPLLILGLISLIMLGRSRRKEAP